MANLWLDDQMNDLRKAPSGWLRVRCVEEAKAYLILGLVDRLLLDNDLGGDPVNGPYPTGYDLVKWMIATGFWPQRDVIINANANAVDAVRMHSLAKLYRPQHGSPFPPRELDSPPPPFE